MLCQNIWFLFQVKNELLLSNVLVDYFELHKEILLFCYY